MDLGPPRSADRFALTFVCVHVILWIGLACGLVLFVPGWQQTFREYRLALPVLTTTVLSWSAWLISFWFFLIPVVPVLAALDWGILVSLRRNPATRRLGLLWALLMLVIPVLMMLIAVVGIMLPLVKIHGQGLSK